MKSIQKYIGAFALLAIATFGCSKDSGETSSLADKNNGGNGQGGSLARFALVGDYMYAVNGNSLKTFNISNRENPGFVKSQTVGADVETIFSRQDDVLFIGARTGMYVYDASNPDELRQVGHHSHVTSCDPVVANENYAYVTLRTRQDEVGCDRGNVNQLDILDISNLQNMKLVNEVQMDFPIGLGLHGDTLLVCDEGVKIYDISTGSQPKFLGKESLNAVDIIPYGDLMIVSTISGIAQYRFKNGKMEFLSSL